MDTPRSASGSDTNSTYINADTWVIYTNISMPKTQSTFDSDVEFNSKISTGGLADAEVVYIAIFGN